MRSCQWKATWEDRRDKGELFKTSIKLKMNMFEHSIRHGWRFMLKTADSFLNIDFTKVHVWCQPVSCSMLLKEWQALKSGQGRWTSPCQSTAKTSEMELARPRSHSHSRADIQLQPGPRCTTPFLPFSMHSQSTTSLQAWIYQTFCPGQTRHHDAWARDKN